MPGLNTRYPDIRMIPFTDQTINYSIAFVFQNYEKLDGAAKKLIEYVVDRV